MSQSDAGNRWDAFISHASEDKDGFVRPLAVALRSLGASIWYDEFSLRLGDSLSQSIDKGLAGSAYGIVVISQHFIKKPWTEYELRGLVARDVGQDRFILPLWHGVSRAQVLAFSPPLADKVALNTSHLDAQEIAIQLLRNIRPDLYGAHPRAELERLASGQAIIDLQAELERMREDLEMYQGELAEYRCPYCDAPLASRMEAPVDIYERDSDTREEFECGLVRFGGVVERPCAGHPQFPKLEDYEFTFEQQSGGRWLAYAHGKTDWARSVSLGMAVAVTRDEALEQLRMEYVRFSRQARVRPREG